MENKTELQTMSSTKLPETSKELRLVQKSSQELQREMDSLLRGKPTATPSEALNFSRMLLGQYPSRDMHDPEIFIKSLTALFTEYSTQDLDRVVKSIPRKCKFLPAIAEIKSELDADIFMREAAIKRTRIELENARQKETDEEKYKNIDVEKRKADLAKLISYLKEKDAELDLNKRSTPTMRI